MLYSAALSVAIVLIDFQHPYIHVRVAAPHATRGRGLYEIQHRELEVGHAFTSTIFAKVKMWRRSSLENRLDWGLPYDTAPSRREESRTADKSNG